MRAQVITLFLLLFLHAPFTASSVLGATGGGGRRAERLEECFAEPQAALELLARFCAPKALGQVMGRLLHEQAESIWFLRTRLIVPGCPLPDRRDMAALAQRGGDAPAVSLLEDIARCTGPNSENYKDFDLIENGVRVHFESCREKGDGGAAVVVDIPLKELEKAQPRLELWQK